MASRSRAFSALTLFSFLILVPLVLISSVHAKHRRTDGAIPIKNICDLQAIQTNLSASYVLANNVDASDFSCNGGVKFDFAPIGGSNPFTGTLDGSGFAIDKLTINSSSSYVGMFGIIGPGASVRNIRLTEINVLVNAPSGSSPAVGALAGANGGTVTLASVQASVKAKGTASAVYIGGMIGVNGGTIAFSHALVSVQSPTSSESLIGGLVGQNSGPLNQLYASGEVSAAGSLSVVGGLAGENGANASIDFAVSDVDVRAGSSSQVGGLVGDLPDGSIGHSYALGTVAAGSGSNVGGLVGESGNCSPCAPLISNSFATGRVSASSGSNIGGLVGLNQNLGMTQIDRTYATGRVMGDGTLGGLVGSTNAASVLTNSYWDLNSSGINDPSKGCGNVPNCAGVTGLSTKQMTDGSLSNFVGFDANAWVPSARKNKKYPYYPYLWNVAFPIPSFPLSNSSPYTISIVTVFDHSLQNARNSGQVTQLYACDEIVQAFDAQIGDKQYGFDRPGCSQPGYENASHSKFVLPGVNYTGVGCSSGSIYLNYDGHPGFDYCAATGSNVYAAVSGVLYYPWKAVGMTKNSQYDAYCLFHTLGEVPDAGPSCRIYYLHLSTHWAVKGDKGPPDCSQYGGDTSGLTGQSFDHDPKCHYIDADGKEILDGDPRLTLPLPEGTHVDAGCQIGLSGDAGVPGAPHLHFEIQQIVPASALNDHGAISRSYFQCFDETKKYKRDGMNITSLCLPADPYGWTGAAGSDTWEVLTGIPSRRFWTQ